MTGSEDQKLAIVIHAFYPDIFADILARLDRLTTRFTLFVSYPSAGSEQVKALLVNKSYRVIAHEIENRGRDIAPFLKIAPRLIEEDYDFILKLHTKKSPHHPKAVKWRDDLYDYLTDEDHLRRNLKLMETNPAIGIISHPDYIVPMRTSWRPNEKRVRELAARMGLKEINIDDDAFAAGSMFLARASALKPLIELSIAPGEFEIEQNQNDGTLAHAVERAFTYSANVRGMELAGSKDTALVTANYARFGGKPWKLKLRRFLRKTARRFQGFDRGNISL